MLCAVKDLSEYGYDLDALINEDEKEEYSEDVALYEQFFAMSGGYMNMTVNLPVKPFASNATYVSEDGKTLEWNLLNLGQDLNTTAPLLLTEQGHKFYNNIGV